MSCHLKTALPYIQSIALKKLMSECTKGSCNWNQKRRLFLALKKKRVQVSTYLKSMMLKLNQTRPDILEYKVIKKIYKSADYF